MNPGRGEPSDCELLRSLLEISSVTAFCETDDRGRITRANEALAALVGRSAPELEGTPLTALVDAAERDRVSSWLEATPSLDGPVGIDFVSGAGVPVTLRCMVAVEEGRLRVVGEPGTDGDRAAIEEMMRLNNELATMARERARRERELRRVREELEQAFDELRTSYWHLQKIQEVLPLCMRCGKVKTDAARWQSLIDYLRENEIFLSHGYCPECAREVDREFGLGDG